MLRLIRTAVLLSVYHVAKGTVTDIEARMNKDDKDDKKYKRKMLVVGMVHTLLGAIYND